MEIDYEKIGLKVGLEIHQQLNTPAKLFCKCKPELFKEEPEITFQRRLRPTQSELGQIDPAAYFEFQKGVKILYEANRATSCLVEMDEEPPHQLNMEAIERIKEPYEGYPTFMQVVGGWGFIAVLIVLGIIFMLIKTRESKFEVEETSGATKGEV